MITSLNALQDEWQERGSNKTDQAMEMIKKCWNWPLDMREKNWDKQGWKKKSLNNARKNQDVWLNISYMSSTVALIAIIWSLDNKYSILLHNTVQHFKQQTTKIYQEFTHKGIKVEQSTHMQLKMRLFTAPLACNQTASCSCLLSSSSISLCLLNNALPSKH